MSLTWQRLFGRQLPPAFGASGVLGRVSGGRSFRGGLADSSAVSFLVNFRPVSLWFIITHFIATVQVIHSDIN